MIFAYSKDHHKPSRSSAVHHNHKVLFMVPIVRVPLGCISVAFLGF